MTTEELYARVLLVDELLIKLNATKKKEVKRYLDLVTEQEMCVAIAEQMAA